MEWTSDFVDPLLELKKFPLTEKCPDVTGFQENADERNAQPQENRDEGVGSWLYEHDIEDWGEAAKAVRQRAKPSGLVSGTSTERYVSVR